MNIFHKIAQSLPDSRSDSRGIVELTDAPHRTPGKPVLQFVAFPVALDTRRYANAVSDSNPDGDLRQLIALRNLVDPQPGFMQYYNPSGSTEQTYETILRGAIARAADSSSITTLLGDARQQFESHRFARMDGSPGWWRPVYAEPDDWYDMTKASERFQELTIDLTEEGGHDAAYDFLGGGEPLHLSIGGRAARKSLDPQTRIRSLRLKYMFVSLRRPWLNPLLFQHAGWYLSQQVSGFCSSGDLRTNAGVLPLLPTGMLLARDVSLDVAWGNADQTFLDNKAEAPLDMVSVGPFPLRPSAPDSGVQLIAFISSLIPYSPKDSDLRAGSVLVKNQGTFVSRFSVEWVQDGRPSARQSGNFPVLAAESIEIPADAKDVSVKFEVMTFPRPIETWKTVATINFDTPIRKCFELTGTTFDAKLAEVGCIG